MMNLRVFTKENKLETISKDIPKFVKDTCYTLFEEKCQIALDRLERNKRNEKVNSDSKALESALKKVNKTSDTYEFGSDATIDKLILNLEISMKELTFLESELRNIYPSDNVFGYSLPETDRIALVYMWTVNKYNVPLNITGMSDILPKAVAYNKVYYGCESWSKERKSTFSELKKDVSNVLRNFFDFSESGEPEDSIYKDMTLNDLPSKYIETLVNFIYGFYNANKGGGITRKHESVQNATKQLLLCFFNWQGCDTIEKKKVKVIKDLFNI